VYWRASALKQRARHCDGQYQRDQERGVPARRKCGYTRFDFLQHALWQAPCLVGLHASRETTQFKSNNRSIAMITEAITTAPPVLAAGWAFLYLLFGGGLGGAALIFLGLKLIGR
jgi:hypothetical protein